MFTMENRWVNKDGKIGIGALVWLFIIAVLVYLGIKFVPPYFTYYMFKGEVDGEAKTAHVYSDQDIIKHIMDRAKESELPIEEKDIVLERRESEIEVSITYDIVVNFFDRYFKTLHLEIHTTQPITAKHYT